MEKTVPSEPKPPTAKGPAEWFIGDVYLDPVVRPTEPSRVNVSAVRFMPGARTAWHAHTISQTLVVTDGVGLHQPRGGTIDQIRAGDVVVVPADVWHWHGATPDHFMTHLSITESPGDGRSEPQWGDHVTDEEYDARDRPDAAGAHAKSA
jgi:quercetin dioxygenase-like cupin family protein